MKPNPLLIIAAIFAASFLGRAIGFANAALNRGDDAQAEDATRVAEDKQPLNLQNHAVEAIASDVEAETAAADTQTDDASATAPVSSAHKAAQNNELLRAIKERSAQLDKKAERVEDRIRTLEIIEKRVEEKLAELRKNNEDLSKLVSYANEASQEDIALLAKMYAQMKPAKAGEIFDKMNPTFAAGFLTEMNSENAALILANMSTDKAYEASMIIASRNAAVSQQ